MPYRFPSGRTCCCILPNRILGFIKKNADSIKRRHKVGRQDSNYDETGLSRKSRLFNRFITLGN